MKPNKEGVFSAEEYECLRVFDGRKHVTIFDLWERVLHCSNVPNVEELAGILVGLEKRGYVTHIKERWALTTKGITANNSTVRKELFGSIIAFLPSSGDGLSINVITKNFPSACVDECHVTLKHLELEGRVTHTSRGQWIRN